MPLSQDFIPLGTDSSLITMTAFLESLAAGKTVAFKTAYQQGQAVYRLFPLSTTDESIPATIRQMALTEISHRKLEGQPIPDFDFTDLNGRHYDKTSTKGNLLVLKCWFVHCVACVKEFPELNRLVDSYPNRDDILFVSLAFDTGKELKNFLSNRQFKYAVVPDCKSFMENKLHTTEYPTHLLVDRQGIIRKVVNRIEELEPFLAREAGANRKSEGGNRKVFTADLPAGRQGNKSAEFRGEKPTLKASAQPL